MSHLGSITGREPTVDLNAMAVMKGPCAKAPLAPVTSWPLKLASGMSVPVKPRSLAALVTPATASVTVGAPTHLAEVGLAGAKLDGVGLRQADAASACLQVASPGRAMPPGSQCEAACLPGSGQAGR